MAKKLLQRDYHLHIAKLLIFWNRHQEFMFGWGNSVSPTFYGANGIRQGNHVRGQLSPLLYNIYSNVLNHLPRAKVVGCHVGVIALLTTDILHNAMLALLPYLQQTYYTMPSYCPTYNRHITQCQVIALLRTDILHNANSTLQTYGRNQSQHIIQMLGCDWSPISF